MGYPWQIGDALLATDLNAAIANAGGGVSVIGHGADPTGAADSTAAFRAALATGSNVFVPAGTYLITGQLTLATATGSQVLRGEGSNSVLLIDTRFDPSITTGVVVMTGGARNEYQPVISDLAIKFVQPTDLVKAATAASSAGANTITVNSVAGIVVGMSVLNRSNPAATPSPAYLTASAPLTVASIAGNIVTLSGNLSAPGVASADQIQFAAVRSMFKTLAAGGTTGPGGTGVRYPWAIYNVSGQSAAVRNVMVINAWNGIYLRSSGFDLATIYMGALNIGIDIDQCFNFPSITDYRFWMWGFYDTSAIVDTLANVYYDGQTIAANLGQMDGLGAHDFKTWVGAVNLTSAWSWGLFTNLMLDGNNANLNIASSGLGFVQITNCYSSKGAKTVGVPITLNANAGFHAIITNLNAGSPSATASGIVVQSGVLQIANSYIWDGLQAGLPMISVTGGSLFLSDTLLDASGPRTDTYISLTGTGALRMRDCDFPQAAGAGGRGVSGGAGNFVALADVSWNGWAVNLPTGANNWLPVSAYANDTAAAAGGVGIGQLYRIGNAVQVRIT